MTTLSSRLLEHAAMHDDERRRYGGQHQAQWTADLLEAAELLADFPESGSAMAADGVHGRHWMAIRTKVLAALAAEGMEIMSDAHTVWLRRVGVAPAEPQLLLPEPDVTTLSDYFDAQGARHGMAYSVDALRAALATTATPAAPAPETMLNGLTEAETAQTASVAGLVVAPDVSLDNLQAELREAASQQRHECVQVHASLLTQAADAIAAQPVVPALRIERPHDEQIEFYIGDTKVGEANHDEHGWAGMASMRALAESMHAAMRAAHLAADGRPNFKQQR